MGDTGIQGYIKSRCSVHSQVAVAWRKSYGASQADIASFLECKKSRIKRIEAGEDSYSAAEIDLLSLFFGIGVQLESPLVGLANEELAGLQMAYTEKRTHGVLGEGTQFVLPPEMNYRTRKREKALFPALMPDVTDLAFSPDEKLVAYSWRDDKYQDFSVWDTASGECVFLVHDTLDGDNWVGAFCFSPDSRYLACVQGEDVIFVYLVKENRLELHCVLDPIDDNIYPPELWDYINTHGVGVISEIRFTPDSNGLMSVNETQGSMRLWDISTKQHIKTWPLRAIIPNSSQDVEYFEFPISDLSFSPDGRFMFIGHGAFSGDLNIYQLQYFSDDKENPLKNGEALHVIGGWIKSEGFDRMRFHCMPPSEKFPMDEEDTLLFAFNIPQQQFGIFQIKDTAFGTVPYLAHPPVVLGQDDIDLHQVVGVDASCVLGVVKVRCNRTLAERYIHPQEGDDINDYYMGFPKDQDQVWVLENLINRQPVVLPPDCTAVAVSPCGKMLIVLNEENVLVRYDLDLNSLYSPRMSLSLRHNKSDEEYEEEDLDEASLEDIMASIVAKRKFEQDAYRKPGWEPVEPEIVEDGDEALPRLEDALQAMIQSMSGYPCYSLLPIDGNEDIDRLTRLIEETTELKYHLAILPDEESIDIRGVLGAIRGETLAKGEVTTDAIKRLAQDREYNIVMIDDASRIAEDALRTLCSYHHQIADLILLITRDQDTFWSHINDLWIANRNQPPMDLTYIMENYDPELLIGAEKARKANVLDDMGTVKCLFCLHQTSVEINSVVWEQNGSPRFVRPDSFECETCGTKHLMMCQDDNRLQGHGESSIRYPGEDELVYKFLRQFWKNQVIEGRFRGYERSQYNERTICCVSEIYEHPRCNFVVIAVWLTDEIFGVSAMMEILGMDRDQLLTLLPQDQLMAKGNDKMGCHHLIINHSGLS